MSHDNSAHHGTDGRCGGMGEKEKIIFLADPIPQFSRSTDLFIYVDFLRKNGECGLNRKKRDTRTRARSIGLRAAEGAKYQKLPPLNAFLTRV